MEFIGSVDLVFLVQTVGLLGVLAVVFAESDPISTDGKNRWPVFSPRRDILISGFWPAGLLSRRFWVILSAMPLATKWVLRFSAVKVRLSSIQKI